MTTVADATKAATVPAGSVLIEPGSHVANVTVPFPASMIATENLLKEGIEKKGFSDVVVTSDRPTGWPLPGEPDYYVKVSWKNAPKVFEVPSAVDSHRKVA